MGSALVKVPFIISMAMPGSERVVEGERRGRERGREGGREGGRERGEREREK